MQSIFQAILGVSVALVQTITPFSAAKPAANISTIPYKPVTAQAAPQNFSVAATSALIIDRENGQVVYARDADSPKPMASLTKLMTAYIIARDHKADEVVTIPSDVKTVQAGDNVVLNLQPGDKATVGALMQPLLIPSANDVAVALAVFDSGSVEAFVAKMNATAKELGLKNTTFKNPTGLDEPNHVSTATDLARLTQYSLASPMIASTVKKPQGALVTDAGRKYSFATTNKLLGQGGVVGVKTGTTAKAGECLITLSQRAGREVITVVLNSPDRFQESRSMIDLTFSLNYF